MCQLLSYELLQDNCSPLNLGNGPVSLTACSDLTSDLGTDLKFQWTVLDAGNGNSTLRGAIDAAYTEGSIDWAGVGFNQDLEMIGGNAFIVKADSSSASGAVTRSLGNKSESLHSLVKQLPVSELLVCWRQSHHSWHCASGKP